MRLYIFWLFLQKPQYGLFYWFFITKFSFYSSIRALFAVRWRFLGSFGVFLFLEETNYTSMAELAASSRKHEQLGNGTRQRVYSRSGWDHTQTFGPILATQLASGLTWITWPIQIYYKRLPRNHHSLHPLQILLTGTKMIEPSGIVACLHVDI